MRKRLFFGILAACLVALVCAPPALAVDGWEWEREVVWYEDGYYAVRELASEPTTRAFNQVVGRSTVTLYSSSHEPLFSFTVRGTFSYNGRTATALRASYSYQIQSSAWRLQSGRAHCLGNQAVAEGTFSGGLFSSRQARVILTCSPDGRLS